MVQTATSAENNGQESTARVDEPSARLIEFSTPRGSVGGLRYDILGYDEIAITNVQPNPLNPRPPWHLQKDDPRLKDLGDSIKTTGQHRPAIVYELIGHYSESDQPGVFRLLQGHRRFDACQLVGVDVLRCLIVPTPKTHAEETTWLGVEESHKEDWQQFFELRHAANLARLYKLPIRHPDVASLTGLTMNDLKLAEKLDNLEPEIQAMVAEYEQLLYEQKVRGDRKKGSRLSALTGVRTGEFTPTKAGFVWDIFEALRENCTLTVSKYNDLDLQHRVAAWSTKGGATHKDLEDFLGLVKSMGKNPQPGFLSELDNLLTSTDRRVRSVVTGHRHGEVKRVDKIDKKCAELENQIKPLLRNATQIGSDVERLAEIESRLYRTVRYLNELADKMHTHINELKKESK